MHGPAARRPARTPAPRRRQRPRRAPDGTSTCQRPPRAPEGISTSILEVTSVRIADVGSLVMADYGHDLVFGTFITPQNEEPHTPVALAATVRALGPGSGDLPGPPVPARVPGHLDPDVLRRRQHGADQDLRQRDQPAVAAAGAARTPGRQPGPIVRGPVRAGPRRGRLLGRDRGDGRAEAVALGGGGRPERGDRPRPGHLGRRPAGRHLRRRPGVQDPRR